MVGNGEYGYRRNELNLKGEGVGVFSRLRSATHALTSRFVTESSIRSPNVGRTSDPNNEGVFIV